ncbi:hypothetical protein M0R04_09260 [Candidatus Dojkabacteria bacterium]|jgi:hypothetical protein|nr:hypothetical protein [Candidatus Dojkabacteria bacterium]
MASCERCWKEAEGSMVRYRYLLKINNCTPEQQAGEGILCVSCGRKTIHQYAKVCMNPDCKSHIQEVSK